MINFAYLKKILNIIKIIFNTVYEFGDRLSNHNVFILAGGLAFNILLYIIPLVLILVSFINIFVDQEQLILSIQQGIQQYLPNTQSYDEIIASIFSEIQILSTNSKLAGIVGFIILLWVASTVVSTLNTCITTIYELEQHNYFRAKLKDLAMTILINILILLYGILLPLTGFATSIVISFFPETLGFFLSNMTMISTNLIVSGLFFYFIYWIIPSSKTKINRWIASRATLIAVIAIELARFAFTWYLTTITNYSRFYGTYAVMVTVGIWLFYSCFIILFSAELSKFIWDRRQKRLLEASIDVTISPIKRFREKQKQKKTKN